MYYEFSKEVFFRLTTFFFVNKNFLLKDQLWFSFLCIVNQKKNYIFQNLLSKFGSERGISIDADSGPPRYVLWCCGSICHQLLTFFQIGCGHTVNWVHISILFCLLYFLLELFKFRPFGLYKRNLVRVDLPNAHQDFKVGIIGEF